MEKPPMLKAVFSAAVALVVFVHPAGAQTTNTRVSGSDALLDLFVKKGYVTQDEAEKVREEANASVSNANLSGLKWKISDGIKSVELFGDIRLRFEDRQAVAPGNARVELGRYRYAARVGLRGDLANDFYYGIRMETAANPRSPWVTFGTTSSPTTPPYQGPFGKSTGGISIGQIYLGWKPKEWLEITAGAMPNPMYTTPMMWDTDINPTGAAEKLKYTVGDVDFFATFGQFLYQDDNPTHTAPSLFPTFQLAGQDTTVPFMLAWQAGFLYHITHNVSFKAAISLYDYDGLGRNNTTPPTSTLPGQPGSQQTPGFANTFVGEGGGGLPGVAVGQNQNASGLAVTANNDGFIFNQTGLDHLQILDVPWELNFKVGRNAARLYGDFAENLEGSQRAEAAAAVYNAALPARKISPQRYDNMAYLVGFAIGNADTLGLTYGTRLARNNWEARVYWQHVEQYALDPNLLDSDFFEGRGNLEGFYAALAYDFSPNVFGTVRYGYANRINKNLGTGGSNQDLPQMNPIEKFSLVQIDFSLKF